jgi:hypothetical protein
MAEVKLTEYAREDLLDPDGAAQLARTSTLAELLERADRRRARGGGASRATVEAAYEDDRADRR